LATQSIKAIKQNIQAEIASLHPWLIEISHTIHQQPEIAFQERQAAALLTEELKREGFTVERGVAGLETAFVATYGQGKPVVAFLAEYDALPKIGHACGHNLIATWAIGAAVAVKRAIDSPCTIKVIGTPAEEGGGGKVTMANAGVFCGLDAAIMMHPMEYTLADRTTLTNTRFFVEFFGKSAHAAASPEHGISALDAVLQVFFSVNAWRQMLMPGARIHGCITHGGDAPNIIPDYAACRFTVRAREQVTLEAMVKRFKDIIQGAALATGATFQINPGPTYEVLTPNRALVQALAANMAALEIPETGNKEAGTGSSDIGNVSRLVPTIHPYYQICEGEIVAHSPEFANAARSAKADEGLAIGATLLAWTGADVVLNPDLRERMRTTFIEDMGKTPQE
jgi:amidohydrolase